MCRCTHFLALSTERAGNSNAPLTRSTVSPRSWLLNAVLGSKEKKKAWASFFLETWLDWEKN